MLQSANTARYLAGVPVKAGTEDFRDALSAVRPLLRPFEVWSVHSEFWLDTKKPKVLDIISKFPDDVLTLLASCISEEQKHRVFGLAEILEEIRIVEPMLVRDARFRRVQRLALSG